MIVAQNMPGMEWIPLIVVLMWGGIGCGAVSMLASVILTKSRFAFRCGLVAVVIGVLSPPLLWILTGSHLSLHGYSLLASPILPGLLGVGLSKIPSGIWLWLARAVLVVTIIVGAILGGRNWYAGSVAARDMLNLVHGSREVEIAEFSIEYQQRKVICDDMAVCRHLAASLRKAKQGRGIDLTIGNLLFIYD